MLVMTRMLMVDVQEMACAWSLPISTRRRNAVHLLGGTLLASGARLPTASAETLQPRTCLVPYETGECALSLQIPVGWRRDPIESPMRLAQFELDPSNTTDVVIFYLPLGQGVEAQLARWENEFPPDSRSSPPVRSGTFDVQKGSPIFLQVAGAWAGGGPAGASTGKAPLGGYAMQAAIVPASPAKSNERQYAFFVKNAGPESVVNKQSTNFFDFVRSMRG